MRGPAVLLTLLLLPGCLAGGGSRFTIGSTTTTQDTGLLEVLLPAFEEDSGARSRAVVAATGEIISKALRGDVDVLFTHSPQRERALVDAGVALNRTPVMYNRFVIAGAEEDPASVRSATNATQALGKIHHDRSLFLSRGDGSGTHDKELEIWRKLGLDPSTFDRAWYKETGTGQGHTLIAASELGAYILIDEATLAQFHQLGRARNIVALFHADPQLRNQYAVTQLDATQVASAVDSAGAATFAAWLTGPRGQSVIGSYRIGDRQVFTPNAHEEDA